MNQIALQQLRNVLIDGKFPSEIVNVEGISCEFTFIDRDISHCNTVVDSIELLTKGIKCTVRGTVVPLTDLPGVYFSPLHAAYSKFQLNTLNALLNNITEFVESAESYGLWLTYTHSDSSCVLSIDHKLNTIQRRWVALNAVRATKNRMEMIGDIFEAAKPWLDKELFKALKEQTDTNTRENAFFDDAVYDKKLRAKARQMVISQQENNAKTEGDIIIVEEED